MNNTQRPKIKFNPVKEDKDGVMARRVIWSTESLDLALKGMEQGKKLVANPFYENNTKLLKSDLVFERTPEEIEEWKKCKDDIIYFCQKYCQLMTPQGIQHIELRDYQIEYLKHLEKNRLSIFLSARQSGKCLTFNTLVKVRFKNPDVISPSIEKYRKCDYCKCDYCKCDYCKCDYYELPLFELYNLYDNRPLWKLRYDLYKKLYSRDGIPKSLWSTIGMLDDCEKDSDQKLIHSFDVNDIEIFTDTGYKHISHVHMTRKFKTYRVVLENGAIIECADTHILFDEHMNQVFVKDLKSGSLVQTTDGPVKVLFINELEREVCMCDVTVDDDNHRFYSNGILSHNTTTSALFMLHYICFNFDKNALVLGQKRKTAVEILDKSKKIFVELPYFIRPGVVKWNESEIVLDNGCRLMAEATTINSGISYTFHCVLADEFAHVPKNIIDKFYNNLFPTITAARARFMITSTQNGYNLFYRIYTAAVNGENEYKPFKVDWYQVPEWNPEKQCWEKRDENWHRLQVANYGSEEAFNTQFGTNFDVSANTLITQSVLNIRRKKLRQFVNKDIPGVTLSDYYFWHPDYNPQDQLKNDYIIITCDLAEGVNKDYTVFMINRMIEPNTGKTQCIGFFKSNKHDRTNCSLSLQLLSCLYCNANHHLISLEWNTYGELFLKLLYENIDKHPIISARFDPFNLVKYYNDSGTRYLNGIKITEGNKTAHCLIFKESYEKDNVINESAQFMTELEKFTDNGTGHYKASFGNDDMVMAQIQLEFVKETLQYKLLRSEFDSLSNKEDSMYYNAYENQLPSQVNVGNTMFDFGDKIDVNNENLRRLINV